MTVKRKSSRSVWLAGVAAIMPVAAATIPVVPVSATPGPAFQPPAGAMLLTRTLRRPLPDGAEVKTERCYEIRFVPDGDGYRVEGKLVRVDVEAPPVLRALAEIELKRADTGMFPMHLDANGQLLESGEPSDSAANEQARNVTGNQIDRIELARYDADQARAFVDRFAARPGLTPWPQDLFRPAPGLHSASRQIPLPNGVRGEVSVSINADASGPSGLLSRLDRKVVSDLGGNARVVEETWTLTSAG